ncbi:MAG: DegT/DnrJ/EryC1/StrS family aminotransferase [Acidobacteriota bacterium]|nr:MAG: DegT/DnrJ/EryC1/StrS family aminotransferase [Acidobacteriota bacterium]
MKRRFTRRTFLASSCAGIAAGGLSEASPRAVSADELPALLGGSPVRTNSFPSWPVIGDEEEKRLLEALRSRRWNRHGGSMVDRFEEIWAARLGAKHCLATSSGTSALVASLNALEIGPGDEVIVPPYTFVATINVVLLQHALPVFVDTDRETSQIDAGKIEAAITKRTRAILPVHLGGSVADMDRILDVAKKHNLPVIEDACQSHLAEWRGRKVGTLGSLGCFSLQASKNLNSGEGGAVVGNDENLVEICRSFHNQGRAAANSNMTYARNGDNRRMTEFQAAILLAQLTRLEAQSKIREENAQHLSAKLSEIPGMRPARMYEGVTRNAYHLYMFRYDPEAFSGLPRDKFLKALRAEGIPASGGYTPLNREQFLLEALRSRAYRYIYSEKDLNDLLERNSRLPQNDLLCREAVWLTQSMLLGQRGDMDQIAGAIAKIHKHAAKLAAA